MAAVAVDCTVSADDHAFGTYDPGAGTDTDSTSSILVECLLGGAGVETSYTLALSTGLSGTYAERTLGGPSDTLGYNLYADSARTKVWGDGSEGSTLVSNTAANATHTVYGRIPAGQFVTAGSYSDSITVTLTF